MGKNIKCCLGVYKGCSTLYCNAKYMFEYNFKEYLFWFYFYFNEYLIIIKGIMLDGSTCLTTTSRRQKSTSGLKTSKQKKLKILTEFSISSFHPFYNFFFYHTDFYQVFLTLVLQIIFHNQAHSEHFKNGLYPIIQ